MYVCLQKGEKIRLSKAQLYINVSVNKDVPFILSSDKDVRALFVDSNTDN